MFNGDTYKTSPLFVADLEGTVISYEYDAIGELTKTVEVLGGETQFVYDSLGQITQIADTGQTA